MIMANEINPLNYNFTSNASYGNTPAPNTPGTMAMPAAGASQTPGSGIWNAISSFASNLNPQGLIGGALNLIGGISQRNFEKRMQQQQMDWNEAMMEKQNQWSLEQWNRTNEYNTPAAQRQRLLDAGLNPMYFGLDGNGNAGAFESAQALGYDRAGAQGIMNPIAGALEGYQTMKQMELMEAQIANTNANTAKQTEETATEVERRNKLIAEIDQTKASIKQIISSANLNDKQREKMDKDLAWLDLLNEATLAEKTASSKLSSAQRDRIEKLLPGEVMLQIKTAEDFEHQWYKIDAEVDKMSKETGILKKDLQYYVLNHMNNGFMGSGLSLPNIWYQDAQDEINRARQDMRYEIAKEDNQRKVEHGLTNFPSNP